MEFQPMSHLKFPKTLPKRDALRVMLEMQKVVNSKIYPIVAENLGMGKGRTGDDFADFEKEAMTKEYLLAIMRECAEALDLINSKPWRRSEKEINLSELKFELIDIQHFQNSLYDIWGMDRDEVLKYYIAKNQENHARVSRNY